jgi:hypothetical protein
MNLKRRQPPSFFPRFDLSLPDMDSTVEKGQMTTTETEATVYEGIRAILASARKNTINAVNSAMVTAYWEIGAQISEAIGAQLCTA